MVKRLNFVIVVIVSLTLLAVCFNLQPTKAAASSLAVQVKNQLSETPIQGASVIIEGPSNHSGVSDVNGLVYFSNIPSGNYSMTVSLESFPNSAPQMIAVTGDTTSLVLFSYTKAYFTYTPRHPYTNTTVTFNGTLSTGSSPITDYVWDFGDGTDSEGVIVQHRYEKAGSYTVTLTVHSDVGAAVYTQLVVVGTMDQDIPTTWVILLFPLFLPLILIWKRKRYYVVIQARAPVCQKNPHCPGNDTKCEDCKVTPC